MAQLNGKSMKEFLPITKTKLVRAVFAKMGMFRGPIFSAFFYPSQQGHCKVGGTFEGEGPFFIMDTVYFST